MIIDNVQSHVAISSQIISIVLLPVGVIYWNNTYQVDIYVAYIFLVI